MRARLLLLILLLTLAASPAARADAEALREFDSPAQRERYMNLLEELRCLVCQNESLASSSADLAQDLRDEVYRLVVVEDRSNEAAIGFLTERYGDFVLYRPPVQPNTWLLWFGPLIMLAIGGAVLVAVVRRRRSEPPPELDATERARAERLLRGGGDPE